jgi:DNA-directed RNA polymerase specialized sigma24 family protein
MGHSQDNIDQAARLGVVLPQPWSQAQRQEEERRQTERWVEGEIKRRGMTLEGRVGDVWLLRLPFNEDTEWASGWKGTLEELQEFLLQPVGDGETTYEEERYMKEKHEREGTRQQHYEEGRRRRMNTTSDSRSARWRAWLSEELREECSEVWKIRRQMGVDRRREKVRLMLEQPVNLPRWLADILAECREEFTARQVEALVYRHGYGLTLKECGDALGCKKQTFRKRLAGAEAKVSHLRGDVLRYNEAWERFVAWAAEEDKLPVPFRDASADADDHRTE